MEHTTCHAIKANHQACTIHIASTTIYNTALTIVTSRRSTCSTSKG